MKLTVFDLDGTLLNTLQDLTDSVNFAMDELGLNRYTCDQVRMMIGNGVAKLMERAVTQNRIELKDKALILQRSFYSQHNGDNTYPYYGICDVLCRLKQGGCVVAVHTNEDEGAARSLCSNHFNGLIDYVCGTTSDSLTKPNPAKVQQLMTGLGVGVNDVVYCGDSDVDIATAKNLGVKCISVTWGYRDGKFLQDCGATLLADSPQQIVEFVLKM